MLHLVHWRHPVHAFRYTVIKNGRQRLFMPNSKFLTSEFIVLDAKKQGRRRSPSPRNQDQSDHGQYAPSDTTRPLGPKMAYGRWGEKLERQRIIAGIQ